MLISVIICQTIFEFTDASTKVLTSPIQEKLCRFMREKVLFMLIQKIFYNRVKCYQTKSSRFRVNDSARYGIER